MSCLNGALERRAVIGGLSLAYLEWPGEGIPVVCMPGTGLVAAMWKDLGAYLAPRHRVLALDPRGHGASDRPPAGYSVAQFSSDLVGFLEQVATPPVVLLGHSFGAGVVLHTAFARPDWAERLILVDPSLYKFRSDLDAVVGSRESLLARAAQRPAVWPDRQALLTSLRARRLYRYWRPDHLECYAERGSYADASGAVRLVFDAQLESQVYLEGAEVDLWSELPAISCPVLFLRGEKSLAMSPERVAEAVERIPNCTLRVLSRCGHFPTAENSAHLNETVAAWLAQSAV